MEKHGLCTSLIPGLCRYILSSVTSCRCDVLFARLSEIKCCRRLTFRFIHPLDPPTSSAPSIHSRKRVRWKLASGGQLLPQVHHGKGLVRQRQAGLQEPQRRPGLADHAEEGGLCAEGAADYERAGEYEDKCGGRGRTGEWGGLFWELIIRLEKLESSPRGNWVVTPATKKILITLEIHTEWWR